MKVIGIVYAISMPAGDLCKENLIKINETNNNTPLILVDKNLAEKFAPAIYTIFLFLHKLR